MVERLAAARRLQVQVLAIPTTYVPLAIRRAAFCYTHSMTLDWAKRMRLMIVGGIAAVIFLLIAGVAIAVFYKVPTCTDQKLNQDEEGIDCGGSCLRICTAQVTSPIVLFARPLSVQGRTDVIAYVQNPNKHAQAKDAPYTVELYGADAVLITRVKGTFDIPAGKTVPLFIRAATKGAIVTRAFVTLPAENIVWNKTEGVYPGVAVQNPTITEGAAPRVTATLENAAFDPVFEVRAIGVVFDAEGNVLAASETLVPVLKAQSSAPVTFTWNEPFTAPHTRFEVVPLIRLP